MAPLPRPSSIAGAGLSELVVPGILVAIALFLIVGTVTMKLRRALAVSEGEVGALFDSGLALSLYGLLGLGAIRVAVTKIRDRAKVDI